MATTKRIPCVLIPVAMILLTGCGSGLAKELLGRSDTSSVKTPCPGDHSGFFVCMSSDSSISDASLAKTIQDGLTSLATLVNSSSFQDQVNGAYTSGDTISAALTATNYTVTITGYCDDTSDVLANAVVGGDTINYNECTVQKDDSGAIDSAAVAGVLLHEISHNVGYTHPDVNPSRTTVPYYLGDTAEADLDTTIGADGLKTGSRKNGGRWQKSFND